MFDRDDNGDIGSVRGNSSQENDIRNIPKNRAIETYQETWKL